MRFRSRTIYSAVRERSSSSSKSHFVPVFFHGTHFSATKEKIKETLSENVPVYIYQRNNIYTCSIHILYNICKNYVYVLRLVTHNDIPHLHSAKIKVFISRLRLTRLKFLSVKCKFACCLVSLQNKIMRK